LDHIVLETVYNIGPTTERGDIFTLNGLDFEYGLLRKYFSFASIEADVLTMPSEQVQLFRFCRHPALDGCRYPRPQEWIFEEGERVVQLSSGRKGLVTAIVPNYLELDFGGENDTGCCPWNDVQKVVEAGDFIIITSGVHQGKSGFVVLVMDDKVNWIDKQAKSSGLDGHIPALEV
jgi:transcription elongation factor